MSDRPEFPDDYYMDRETFEEEYADTDFNAYYPEKRHFECDFCSKGVPYASEPRVAQYLTDRSPTNATRKDRMINETGMITTMATYCDECSFPSLYFPCRGYTEARVMITVDADQMIRDPEITDISPRSDGIPWDPAEVSEAITGIPFDVHASADPSMAMAPENIVTFFLSIGAEIDIAELVDHRGEIDPKALGRARKAHEEFSEKMRSEGFGRKNFRDHVAGLD